MTFRCLWPAFDRQGNRILGGERVAEGGSPYQNCVVAARQPHAEILAQMSRIYYAEKDPDGAGGARVTRLQNIALAGCRLQRESEPAFRLIAATAD